jgi:transcriptional regulator with XRE-family HTH domain
VGAERNLLAVSFGANMRRCRHRAGLTQEELAFRTSLHRSDVSLLERGCRQPRLGTIIKIANPLSVSIDELLEGIDWKPGATGGKFACREAGDAPSE